MHFDGTKNFDFIGIKSQRIKILCHKMQAGVNCRPEKLLLWMLHYNRKIFHGFSHSIEFFTYPNWAHRCFCCASIALVLCSKWWSKIHWITLLNQYWFWWNHEPSACVCFTVTWVWLPKSLNELIRVLFNYYVKTT